MAKSFNSIQELDQNSLMIVDALNLAFRYKHSRSTEFVEDYIKVVRSLQRSYNCEKVIIACDKGSSKYRKEILPEYKGNRKEKYDKQTEAEAQEFLEFIAEFERTLLKLEEEFPVIRFDKVEADDIAAYIVKKIDKYPQIQQVWLISSDKDWDTLISEKVSRFSYVTRKETTWENWNTHYDCEPEQYISIKCLTGDSGDNVPGIPGIGAARAASLIKQYDNVLDIYYNLPIDSKYKYIKSLNDSGDLILQNLQLMDLLSFCEDAIGEYNCLEIDEILGEVYAN